jgi:hypothetical protein
VHQEPPETIVQSVTSVRTAAGSTLPVFGMDVSGLADLSLIEVRIAAGIIDQIF